MKDPTAAHARYVARHFQIDLVLRHAMAEEHPHSKVEGCLWRGFGWFTATDGETLEFKAGDERFVYAASGEERKLLVARDREG